MQDVFCLRPHLIAGRSGPDLEPWNPAELAGVGSGSVLSVNDAAAAIREVRRMRPLALSVTGYADFALDVVSALHGD